jgi:hypothetical protein
MMSEDTKTEKEIHPLLRHSGEFRPYGVDSVLCSIPTHAARALELAQGQQFEMVFAKDGKSFTVSWE